MPENQFGFDEHVALRTEESPSALPVRYQDWEYLRGLAERSTDKPKLWVSACTLALGAGVTALISAYASSVMPFYWIGGFMIALAIFFGIAHSRECRFSGNSVQDICKFMDHLERKGDLRNPPRGVGSPRKETVDSAVATMFAAGGLSKLLRSGRKSPRAYTKAEQDAISDKFAGHDPPPAAKK